MLLNIATGVIDLATSAFQNSVSSTTYLDDPTGEMFALAKQQVVLGASLITELGSELIGGALNGILSGLLVVVGFLEHAPEQAMAFPEPVLLNTPPPPPGFSLGSGSLTL